MELLNKTGRRSRELITSLYLMMMTITKQAKRKVDRREIDHNHRLFVKKAS